MEVTFEEQRETTRVDSSYYFKNMAEKDEMEGRVCSCPETGQPDEFGDGSSLPFMSMEIDNNLSCNKCIYCIKKNEKI